MFARCGHDCGFQHLYSCVRLSRKAVKRAWSLVAAGTDPGTIILEMQNASLADSAVRVIHGLELYGNKLKVRKIKNEEMSATAIERWARAFQQMSAATSA